MIITYFRWMDVRPLVKLSLAGNVLFLANLVLPYVGMGLKLVQNHVKIQICSTIKDVKVIALELLLDGIAQEEIFFRLILARQYAEMES